jgi:hypothetical protein
LFYASSSSPPSSRCRIVHLRVLTALLSVIKRKFKFTALLNYFQMGGKGALEKKKSTNQRKKENEMKERKKGRARERVRVQNAKSKTESIPGNKDNVSMLCKENNARSGSIGTKSHQMGYGCGRRIQGRRWNVRTRPKRPIRPRYHGTREPKKSPVESFRFRLRAK